MMPGMDFEPSDRCKDFSERLTTFMDERVYPAEPVFEAQLAERRVVITLEPEARVWLAEKGYDPVYGARPLARVIQTEVRDPLTDEILFGRLEHGGSVNIRLDDDRLVFDIVSTPAPSVPIPEPADA